MYIKWYFYTFIVLLSIMAPVFGVENIQNVSYPFSSGLNLIVEENGNLTANNSVSVICQSNITYNQSLIVSTNSIGTNLTPFHRLSKNIDSFTQKPLITVNAMNVSNIERRPMTINWTLAKESDEKYEDVNGSINLANIDESSGIHSLYSYLPWTDSDISLRDQSGTNLCWAFAYTGLYEIEHSVQTGDKQKISIEFLARYLRDQYNNLDGPCTGGTGGFFVDFYRGLWGNPNPYKFIPWSNTNANFQETTSTCTPSLTGAVSQIPYYQVDPNTFVPSFQWMDGGTHSQVDMVNQIKSLIDSGHAVGVEMGWPDGTNSWNTFCNFWNYLDDTNVYNPDSRSGSGSWGGHVILIIGYNNDDNTWEVLNSWGPNSNHPHGTFKMKMYFDYAKTYGMGQSTHIAWAKPVWDPTIIAFSPSSAQNTQSVTISIAGTNFCSGDTAYLVQSGTNNYIYAQSIVVNSPNSITCTFPITGAAPGDWYLGVQNSIGDGTLTSGLTITQPGVWIFRNGVWHINTAGISSWTAATDRVVSWGLAGDTPLLVNGKIGVFRNGVWHIDTVGFSSWTAATDQVVNWGLAGDIPVVINGKIGVFRNGVWHINKAGISSWTAATDQIVNWGLAGDIPVVVNGKIGVFRNGVWHIDTAGISSWTAATDQVVNWGLAGDKA